MDIRSLKEQARQRLEQQTFPHRQLALIHMGVYAAAMLVYAVIDFLVSQKMDTIQGLAGMGMLSALQTVRLALQYISNIALPFWEIGFVGVALGMARQRQVKPADLTMGFRRFGPVLRLFLLRGLIFGGSAIVCIYAAAIIYVFTPFSQSMMDLMLPMVESGATMEQMQTMILELPMEDMQRLSMPVMGIFLVLYGVVAAVLFYRFRLADLAVMDIPHTGARASVRISGMLSRKKKLQLLRLDLSFWWYYALQLLCALVYSADVVLAYAGIEAPMDANGLYFICFALGMGAQVILFRCAGSYVHTTWAVAYDQLLGAVTIPQPNISREHPWEEPASEN